MYILPTKRDARLKFQMRNAWCPRAKCLFGTCYGCVVSNFTYIVCLFSFLFFSFHFIFIYKTIFCSASFATFFSCTSPPPRSPSLSVEQLSFLITCKPSWLLVAKNFRVVDDKCPPREGSRDHHPLIRTYVCVFVGLPVCLCVWANFDWLSLLQSARILFRAFFLFFLRFCLSLLLILFCDPLKMTNKSRIVEIQITFRIFHCIVDIMTPTFRHEYEQRKRGERERG